MADITLRILGQKPLPLNLGSDNSETLSVGSGVTESRLQEVLTDYVPKSDIDDTLSIEGDVAEAKATGDAIAEINAKLADILPSDSASGAIASFSDGAKDFPLKSLEVEIEPKQDLHGLTPYPAGGGKNKLPPTASFTQTTNGITFSSSGDGIYKLSGTASATAIHDVSLQTSYTFPSGNMYLHLNNATANGSIIVVLLDSSNGQIVNRGANNVNQVSSAISADGRTAVKIRLYVANGTAISGTFTLSPALLDTNTVTAFAPYSNICPITGFSSVNVVRTGRNLLNPVIAQYNSQIVCFDSQNTTTYNTYLKEGTYTISYTKVGSVPSLYMRGETATSDTNLGTVTTKTFTVTKAEKYKFWVYAGGGVNASDISNIQIEVGSTTTDFEPYTGETYTIPLPSTVYGGKIKDGVLTVDRILGSKELDASSGWTSVTNTKRMDISNLFAENIKGRSFGTNNPNYISNMCNYAYNTNDTPHWYSGADSSKDVRLYIPIGMTGTFTFQAIAELATPITIPLTPTEIKTLLGDNNIFADSGDVAVVYSADIAKYIEKKLA